MLRRCLRIFFIAFQVVWLNAVLPGHTRGVVTVPGYESGMVSESGSCCASHNATDTDDREPGSENQRGRAAHCAICVFAARLSTPPTIIEHVAPLRFAEFVEPASPHQVCSAQLVLTYHGRAPPVG